MKALWIRVQARKVSSLEINRLADALRIPCVHALGHYTALGGEIAEALPDGNIAEVADATIERWAQWKGKRGAFAAAVRDVMQAEDGEFDEWQETMGQLVQRRAADRARKHAGNSTEIPRKRSGNSTEIPTFSAATERNGNGTERNGTETGSNKRSSEYPSRASVAASVAASAPPADAGQLNTPNVNGAADRFLQAFYANAGEKRRDDVIRQLSAAFSGSGALLAKGQYVRAGSAERLVRKIDEVIAEGATIKDRDKAIRVLLLKLGDTSDGSAPGVAQAAAVKQEQRATQADVEAAEEWFDQQSLEFVDGIERQLDAELALKQNQAEEPFDGILTVTDHMSAMVRDMARTALVVKAWRDRPPNKPPDGGRPHTGR